MSAITSLIDHKNPSLGDVSFFSSIEEKSFGGSLYPQANQMELEKTNEAAFGPLFALGDPSSSSQMGFRVIQKDRV